MILLQCFCNGEIKFLFFCVKVRKKAQAVIPVMMGKVGYDAMLKQSGKLKVESVANPTTSLNLYT